jgi:uncharacterized heparinase superfamily protein
LSPAKKALLYWNTVRYLKPIQIYRRFWFRYHRPSLNLAIPTIALAKQQGVWQPPVAHPQTMLEGNTFRFLNRVEQLTSTDSWNSPNLPKLWLYNLHYFDDLNAQGAQTRFDWHHNFIRWWIVENPPSSGNGWEPYPTSLRIVNWIKWILAGNTLAEIESHSLYLQSRWLSQRLEWHLLGNHLLANAKALIFAGMYFSDDEASSWLNLGRRIYDEQIAEQILVDGVHFELSPMYHAIILEDVLDLFNICQTYPEKCDASFNQLLRVTAQKMLAAHQSLIHPDGQISFFNDAAFGVCATFSQLCAYAQSLGLETAFQISRNSHEKAKNLVLTHLNDAGYVRIENEDAYALLDVGCIGPDYLPGHAHADTLSFELSVFGERLIVNGGTSTYASSALRNNERSTAAHSTVEVGGQNSSEVWGQFRVAKRAYPNHLRITNLAPRFEVQCSHDGYQRLSPGLTHTRTWKMSEGVLLVEDQVGFGDNKSSSLKPPKSLARYIFHPSAQIKFIAKDQWELQSLNMQCVQLSVLFGNGHIEESDYASEFGKIEKTQCLVVELVGSDALNSQVQIQWG